jgi:addiction module HigA family antidote
MSIMRPEGGWNVTRPPVHPGEMLRAEFMKPLGISINGLALELHVPVTRISRIVNEHRGITADTALRLARHFGTSADFWMNIQKDYELILTRHKSLKTIERQVRRRTSQHDSRDPTAIACSRRRQIHGACGNWTVQVRHGGALSDKHISGRIALYDPADIAYQETVAKQKCRHAHLRSKGELRRQPSQPFWKSALAFALDLESATQ